MKKETLAHEGTIDYIVNRLGNKYDYIGKNIVYDVRGIGNGEVDVFALKKDRFGYSALLFEAKGSKGYRQKAIKQLDREERCLILYMRKIYKFYVCPKETGSYHIERIENKNER